MVGLIVFSGIGHLSVHLSETVSNALSEFLASVGGLEVVVADVLEVEIVDEETSGHHVILVDVFDEGLDASLFDELLLVEAALGCDQVASDACDEEVGELVALRGSRGTLLPVS